MFQTYNWIGVIKWSSHSETNKQTTYQKMMKFGQED